jgi:hypothetical protein
MTPLWLAQMCEWPSGASRFSTTRGGIGTHCPSSRAYQSPSSSREARVGRQSPSTLDVEPLQQGKPVSGCVRFWYPSWFSA